MATEIETHEYTDESVMATMEKENKGMEKENKGIGKSGIATMKRMETEEQWKELPDVVKMKIEQAVRDDNWENILSLMESSVVAFEKMVDHICKLSLEDPLVNVLIAFKNTGLALDVVGVMKFKEDLEKKNFKGDTALHVAASVQNITVARAMLDRNPKLIFITNSFNETPLHKAALNGNRDIFWELVVRGSNVRARRIDGTTILHCAVIENHFGLALEIAEGYPDLIEMRDQLGLTILHHMVTMTEVFGLEAKLSPIKLFVFKSIILEKDSSSQSKIDDNGDKVKESSTQPKIDDSGDIEKDSSSQSKIDDNGDKVKESSTQPKIDDSGDIEKDSSSTQSKYDDRRERENCLDDAFPMGSVKGVFGRCELLEVDHGQSKEKTADEMSMIPSADQRSRNKFYSVSNLVEKRRWIIAQMLTIFINKQRLIKRKREYESALKLLLFVANKSGYWTSLSLGISYKQDLNRQEKKPDNTVERWMETPLTLGARMGLDQLVLMIMNQHPGAAKYLGKDGNNVLHVAVQYRRLDILHWIESTHFKDPRLKTWLTSAVDYFGNTILHFAARPINKTSAPLQMLEEFKWFKRVMKLLPRELVHHRNNEGKTAQELFSESHTEMVEDGKRQLTNTARTCCAALVSAITFAAGFSIVSDQEKKGKNGTPNDILAFKIFSHAYVVGLSCGAMALVQFMALLMSNYSEQDFRHAVPIQYFSGIFSLFLAMMAMLVAFACNTYVSLYGGSQPNVGNTIPIILEIISFPALCLLVLRCQGITLFGTWWVKPYISMFNLFRKFVMGK